MARPRVLGPKDKEEILRRARSGETYVSIARDFGVTPAAIAYHTNPVLPSRRIRKLSDSQIGEAVLRWRRGDTVAELAREFGVGHTTMKKHIMKCTKEPIGRVRRAPLLSIPGDPLELAYLAGILDGEGCISKHRQAQNWTDAITNTSPELEQWLKEIGGLFYYPPRRPSVKFDGTFNKQRFEWKVGRAWDVLHLLEAVSPYLRIKRKRAEEAIAEIRARFGDPPKLPSP